MREGGYCVVVVTEKMRNTAKNSLIDQIKNMSPFRLHKSNNFNKKGRWIEWE